MLRRPVKLHLRALNGGCDAPGTEKRQEDDRARHIKRAEVSNLASLIYTPPFTPFTNQPIFLNIDRVCSFASAESAGVCGSVESLDMRRDRQGSRLTFPRVPVPQPQLDDLDGDGWGFMSSVRVPASSPASGVKQDRVAPRPGSLPQRHLRGHAHTRSSNDLPSLTQRQQQQQQQQQ